MMMLIIGANPVSFEVYRLEQPAPEERSVLYFINTVTNEKSIECGRRSPSGDREFRARRSPVGDGLPHSEVQFRPENVIVLMKPTTKAI
jgi:hypothetical protein